MTIPKESILLVDDEEAIRCILTKGLEMRGYACDEAENGEQALAKLKINPSDLVILDINMPGRLGSEVLPDITSRFPETAVIMASGVTDNTVIVSETARRTISASRLDSSRSFRVSMELWISAGWRLRYSVIFRIWGRNPVTS